MPTQKKISKNKNRNRNKTNKREFTESLPCHPFNGMTWFLSYAMLLRLWHDMAWHKGKARHVGCILKWWQAAAGKQRKHIFGYDGIYDDVHVEFFGKQKEKKRQFFIFSLSFLK